ncbi:hypothetical protein GCM10020295_78180 [Streptomyces cinereospinus]
MDVDHGATAVEFGQQGLEARIPEVGALGVGEQHHALRAELVQSVGGLGHTALHVRERQRREEAEPVMTPRGQPGPELVDPAGQFPRLDITPSKRTPGTDRDRMPVATPWASIALNARSSPHTGARPPVEIPRASRNAW